MKRSKIESQCLERNAGKRREFGCGINTHVRLPEQVFCAEPRRRVSRTGAVTYDRSLVTWAWAEDSRNLTAAVCCDGTTKIAIFMVPWVRRNTRRGLALGRWDHEFHEDFDENYGRRGGGLGELGEAIERCE